MALIGFPNYDIDFVFHRPLGHKSPKLRGVELRHLRYFLAVADAAHFTRAAQTLWVSQPTLSQQIKQLEDELGAPLFHRGAGGVQLTGAGEKFRPYAERVLREMEAAVSVLGQIEPSEISGEKLQIGALEGTADYLLPDVVARAVSESRLEVTVEILPALELQWAVAREELDLAIGTLPVSSVAADALFDEDLAVWSPPGHRLGANPRARLAELAGVSLFCTDQRSPLRALLNDAAARADVNLKVVAQFPGSEAVLRAATGAQMPAILPAPMLWDALSHQKNKGWRIVALTNPRPHRTIALLRRKGREENPAIRAFVAHLNAVVSELLRPEEQKQGCNLV